MGGKVKFLFGLAYADVKANDVKFRMAEDKWAVTGNVEATAAVMNTKFTTSDKVDPDDPDRHRIDV